MTEHDQGLFTKGIYEFEDPSGCLIAARIPSSGSAALFDGTRVLVKPTQKALLIYQGKLTDEIGAGNHELHTENFPIITKLANWRFGMQSPLEAEIWFFSTGSFVARKWGTAQPILMTLSDLGSVPCRGYGNFNVCIDDPKKFYATLVGEKTAVDISELDDFIQGQILECLPLALKLIKSATELNSLQDKVSEKLEDLVNNKLDRYGIELEETQILSLTPPAEVIQAMDEKVAMQIIGDPKQYMLYKMANRLDHLKDGNSSSDPASFMMTMMAANMANATATPQAAKLCKACHFGNTTEAKFCSHCGGALAP
jgi:membrane protease subunit (stomatin/prohibitin family)